MVASTDKSKVDPEVKVNNNNAYMYSTQFKGADVPLSSIPDVQTSTSSHRLVKPLIFDLPVRKDYDFKEGSSPPSIKEWFTFVLERADGEPVLNEDGTTVAEMKNPVCIPLCTHLCFFPNIRVFFPWRILELYALRLFISLPGALCAKFPIA